VEEQVKATFPVRCLPAHGFRLVQKVNDEDAQILEICEVNVVPAEEL
jgi:hypothetical protein